MSRKGPPEFFKVDTMAQDASLPVVQGIMTSFAHLTVAHEK